MTIKWHTATIDNVANVEYGTRVVQKRDGGSIFPVYGGGGATFFMDSPNRRDRLIISRFGMSERCTRFVKGDFYLNDSGLTLSPKANTPISQRYLDYQCLALNDVFFELGKGAAQKNLDLKAFREIKIKYPDNIQLQNRIIDRVDAIFAEIDKATAAAEANAKNAKVLLQNYLNDLVSREKSEVISLKLGDSELLQLIDGDRGSNYPNKSDFSPEGYCLFLNTKNVLKDGFSFSEKMFITKNKDETLRKGKLARGDVVLTTRGTLGNIGWYSDEVPFDHVRINSGMLILRANHKVILPEFLFELLRSNIIQREILNQKSGAAQPQLPIHTLKDFTIPIPKSLDTQSKYVRLIKDFQLQSRTLSDCYESKLRLLVNLKNSILQQAFNGELVKDQP